MRRTTPISAKSSRCAGRKRKSRREGADQDAAEDVPEDEGLPGRPRGGGAEDGGDET
jgi:hypothetical protein